MFLAPLLVSSDVPDSQVVYGEGHDHTRDEKRSLVHLERFLLQLLHEEGEGCVDLRHAHHSAVVPL